MIKVMGSGAREPGLNPDTSAQQLCDLEQIINPSVLCLRLLVHKVILMIIHTSKGCFEDYIN